MQLRNLLIPFLSLLLALSATAVLAKGGEMKFGSLLVSVDQTDELNGTIEVAIHDVVVPIIVNGDTEIAASGEEVTLAELSAGDFVRVQAFFAVEGLAADSVEVLDTRQEEFRFRGQITAIDEVAEYPVITLLGVDVAVDADTDITRRGGGQGNDVAIADLDVGDEINVIGVSSEGRLLAIRMHVGSREQGNIELEGEITEVADTQISLAIEGGATVPVVIDDETSVVGDLEVGSFAEVEGQLQADLSLIAFEIVVDADGDGDADDDFHRGKRGDEHSRGRGNAFGKDKQKGDDDADDESEDSDSSDRTEVGAETLLGADGVELSGKAEYSYVAEGDVIEQQLEVELEDAATDASYEIVVFFGDDPAEFGDFTANGEGHVDVKFRSGDTDDPALALDDLLPEGRDVRGITGIQIRQGGDVIIEGDF